MLARGRRCSLSELWKKGVITPMNTRISNITKAIDTLLAELVAANKEILQQANNEREEMNALIARMTNTQSDILALNEVYEEVADELHNMAEEHAELAGKIACALDAPVQYCPSVPYENLVDFCDQCGAEIVYDDHYTDDPDGSGILCGDCSLVEVESDFDENVSPNA